MSVLIHRPDFSNFIHRHVRVFSGAAISALTTHCVFGRGKECRLVGTVCLGKKTSAAMSAPCAWGKNVGVLSNCPPNWSHLSYRVSIQSAFALNHGDGKPACFAARLAPLEIERNRGARPHAEASETPIQLSRNNLSLIQLPRALDINPAIAQQFVPLFLAIVKAAIYYSNCSFKSGNAVF